MSKTVNRQMSNNSIALAQSLNLNISVLVELSAGDLADNYPEIFKNYGAISFAHDKEFYPLAVLESAAGYFIGTWNDGGPQRESEHYFKSKDLAKIALNSGNWSQWLPWYM